MKSVFIPFNQAYKERIIEILSKHNLRGFTFWESVQGRGTHRGEPHYGSHAWPTMNSAMLVVTPEDKVEALLAALHALDKETESQGLHAYVWNIEAMI